MRLLAPGRAADAADPTAAGPSQRRAGEGRGLGLWDLVVGDEFGVAQHSADVGCPARGAERLLALGEEGRVGGGEVLPLGRDVVLVEDGLHRADGLAGAAVHAFVGVDVEHAVALVDAVDRTLFDAGLVLDVDAGFGDDVGHLRVDPLVGVYSGCRPDPTGSLASPSSGRSTAPATTAT